MNDDTSPFPTFLFAFFALAFFVVGVLMIKNPEMIQKWEVSQYGNEKLQKWRKEKSYIRFLRYYGIALIAFSFMFISMIINHIKDGNTSMSTIEHSTKNKK